jgi:S1-C subfamily serine protease
MRYAIPLAVMLTAGFASARADTDPAVLQAEAQRIAVMDKAKDAVLAIFSSAGTGGGSGVVISPDGFALTNFHVVKPCGNAMKCGMADGKVYDAVVVGLDPTGDVALIKLVGRNDFPAATMGDSDKLRVGDWCFAMGNPFLLATDFRPTVTYGIVSGVHRYQPPAGTLLEYADCIQTDASINPGNSGGPLFDAEGRLIGINGRGSFEKRGRVNVGVAYAISINQIKNFLGVLHSGRIVDHATLGATVSTDENGRVVVSDILESSDAYRRGLRLKDEIVSFGGRPITTPNGFKNVLGIYPKGWRVPLSFRRDAQLHNIYVRLTGVHDPEDLLEKAEGGPKIMPMPIPKPGDKPEEKPGRKPAPGEKPKRIDAPKPGEKPARKATPGETDATAFLAAAAEEPKTEKDAKPEEKPKDAKPDSKPGEKPREAPKVKPMPIHPMMPRPAPMPEHLKKLFEEKHGYANYYFNKQQRDRVLAAWKKRCDLAGLRGTWTLSGTRDGGGKYAFTLTDAGGTLKLPTEEVKWEAGDNLTDSLVPVQSGGLLPALFVLRRLAVEGPAKLDEVYYLGTAPLPGQPGLVDVLAGLHRKADCRFMFHPTEGHLLAMEFYGDDESDPCELHFSEYRQIDGRWVPGRIDVRVGETPFATFKIEEAKFEKPEKK